MMVRLPASTDQRRGELIALEENLWVVNGVIQMPAGPLPRRMTIARLADGGLVIFSAIALEGAAVKQVEALGHPRYLVVPNAFHREDAAAWKARYPEMRVVAPAGARQAASQVVPVDETVGAFSDPAITFVSVPGTGDGESALMVRSQAGTTLVINDLIGNVQDARGLMRFVLLAMGFAGRGPQVPRMFVARVVKDKPAVAGQFRTWAAEPQLKRIIISHGSIVEEDAPGVLTRLARSLSPGS